MKDWCTFRYSNIMCDTVVCCNAENHMNLCMCKLHTATQQRCATCTLMHMQIHLLTLNCCVITVQLTDKPWRLYRRSLESNYSTDNYTTNTHKKAEIRPYYCNLTQRPPLAGNLPACILQAVHHAGQVPAYSCCSVSGRNVCSCRCQYWAPVSAFSTFTHQDVKVQTTQFCGLRSIHSEQPTAGDLSVDNTETISKTTKDVPFLLGLWNMTVCALSWWLRPLE